MKNKYILWFIYIIGIFWLTGFGLSQSQTCINWSWNCSRNTQVWVTLSNSYSWSIDYFDGNIWQFISWSNIYISNLYNQILVSATDTSIYTISGNTYTWSIWWWSGNYTNTQGIYISSWDGVKYIQSNFLKIAEFYNSNVLQFVLDQTPPSKPQITWPSMWSLQQNTITFAWTASSDTWVWLSWYYIYFSLNPNWPYTKIRVGSDNQYNINSDLLPSWTIYRYVSAIDYLWNESSPVYGFFHNKLPTILNGNIFHNPELAQTDKTKNEVYPKTQDKEHFVANTDKVQSECKIHWYDDFSDCKAVIENKYILKNKIYESYFAVKWFDEDRWLLPSALPNSWVEYISEDQIDNSQYAKLLPKISQDSECMRQYINYSRFPRIIVIILSLYIVYDKTKKNNKE